MNRKPLIIGGISLGVIALGVGAFFLVRYLRRKSAPDFATLIQKQIDQEQAANIGVIAQEFADAGLPPSITAAAIVNAVAESSLRNSATGDSGHSIGLFQLHDRGAGEGLSVEYRQDPHNNTRTILEREVLTSRGQALRDAADNGAKVDALAAIFSRDIERPKDQAGQMAYRSSLAQQLFPTMV